MMAIGEDPETMGSGMSAEDDTGLDEVSIRRITGAAGLVTAAIGGLGLIGLTSGITAFTSVLPGYKTIAISAALIWLFLGLVLAFHAVRLLRGRLAPAVQVVLAGIAVIETIELVLSLMGSHSIVETVSVLAGSALFGHPTTPISPVASALIIPATVALFFLLTPASTQKRGQRIQDAAGITGLAIALVALTFVLSYGYGAPFLYNTALIPIALTSALGGLFTGIALVAAAGPRAIPLKYLSGSSTRGRLLRVFVPLVILLTLAQNLLFFIIADLFQVQDALLLSVCIVVFVFVTAGIITRFSSRIGRDLEQAEEALVRKNEDLAAINEELTTMSEELRANNDELLRNEKALRDSLQRNTFLADILEKASQPFGVSYLDGGLGIVNRAFEELTGYAADELRGIDWAATLTPPKWQEVEQQSLAELHRTRKPVRYEKECIRKDGTIVDIELLAHLVEDEAGSPQYYYSFITDITEQKRNREILSLSNRILRSAENHHSLQPLLEEYIHILQEYTGCDSIGVRILDEKGTIPYQAYTGFSREFYELESPLSIRADTCMCINVIKGTTDPSLPFYTAGGSFTINATTKFLATVSEEDKGKTRNVCNAVGYESVALIPIRKGDRIMGLIHLADHREEMVPEKMVGVLEQAAYALGASIARVQTEEALREREKTAQATLAATKESIWLFGTDDTILMANPTALERVGGRDASEVIGRCYREFMTPELGQARRARIEEVINSRQPLQFEDTRDGIIFDHTFYPVFDETSAVSSIAAFSRDITMLKQTEEVLLKKNEDLSILNEELAATQEELRQNIDELTTMEHELRETGQYLENLIQYANAPIIVWDPAFRITRFNHAFELLIGRKAADVIGQPLNILFPEKYVEPVLDIIRKTTGGERLDVVEIPILHQNGEVRTVLWNSATLFEADGKTVLSTIAQGQDITERKRAEKELHEAHLRLTHHIDNSPLAVVEFDAQFRVTRWSDEAIKMFGWTMAEVMGRTIGEILWVYEEDVDRVAAISADMMNGKAPRNRHTNRNYRKDGTVITCEWYNSALRDDSGELVSILSQVLDVTERDRATADLLGKNQELNTLNEELAATQEELRQNIDELMTMEYELRETSQYLENLILYANAPIIVWNPQFKITRFNHAFELLIGRKAADVIGQPLEILFPEKYAEPVLDIIRKTTGGERLNVVEIPIIHQNGEVRTVLWNSATIFEADGKTVLSTIAQGQDITERKRAEEVLMTFTDNLKASNRELEQFAYIASHDLKEPLRMVKSFSQLLEKRYKGRLDADADEFIGYIVDGAQRMEALINDLLSYSRINQSIRPAKPIDLNQAIDEATFNLNIPIRERNARITQGTMPSVQEDPSQMVHLFQNLIANAIKYCPRDRDPEISINAERTGRDWTFSVKDNGIGIDPAYHEQIFLIFKRLHSRTEYPGTGIGLAICRRIVERHGGRIWVESEEGKGSTFFFTIPERPS
jgi:PAS domain S-box-containing protein